MPAEKRVRGVSGHSSKTLEESNSEMIISGDIDSLHVLVRRFEQELLGLKKKNMDGINTSAIDAAERRVRMIALLEEFASLANQETALGEFLQAANILRSKLTRQFETESSPSGRPVPDKAPELWEKRVNRDETPGEFIERVYSFCLDNLALYNIRKLNPRLYHDLYTRNPGGPILPSGRRLLTKKEINDATLRQQGFLPENPNKDAQESLRLVRVYHSRSRKPLGRSHG